MTSIGIVVATFGNEVRWAPLAERAIASAASQEVPDGLELKTVWTHGDSLHEARNEGADLVKTDWLIFLDADDTLRPGYVKAMIEGHGDIRQPETVTAGNPDEQPIFIPPKDSLRSGNWIVIGAACRASLFYQVGGFRDLPIYEDWDLWIRMANAGAEIGQAPGAVYEVTVMPDSRNQADHEVAVYWFNRILQETS